MSSDDGGGRVWRDSHQNALRCLVLWFYLDKLGGWVSQGGQVIEVRVSILVKWDDDRAVIFALDVPSIQ